MIVIFKKVNIGANSRQFSIKIIGDLPIFARSVAMAWCIKNEDVSCALTGASKPSQLIDTVKSIDVSKKWTR